MTDLEFARQELMRAEVEYFVHKRMEYAVAGESAQDEECARLSYTYSEWRRIVRKLEAVAESEHQAEAASIKLSERDSRSVAHALLNPPPAGEALSKAIERHEERTAKALVDTDRLTPERFERLLDRARDLGETIEWTKKADGEEEARREYEQWKSNMVRSIKW